MTLTPHRPSAAPRQEALPAGQPVDAEQSLELWSTAAIGEALQNGDIDIWKRIAAAVRRDPYGRTACQVEEVGERLPPNGVSKAMREVLYRARIALEANERAELVRLMRSSIDRSGLNDHEFALRIGVKPEILASYLDGDLSPSACQIIRMQRLSKRFAKAKSGDLAGTSQLAREP
jgi:hypothetical protein